MNSNWKKIPLGDLAEIKGGKRLPKGTNLQTEKNTHPYIRVRDMHDGYISKNDLLYVPNDVFPRISKYIINKNDVFISIVGTIGLIGIIDSELDGANLTENAAKICVTSNDLLPQFLVYYLNSREGQHQINSLTVGTTQLKLALIRIEKILVPVPPINEQEKIIETISSLDNKIELNRKMNQTLESMARAIFKSWFVDFDPVYAKMEGRDYPLPHEIMDLFPDELEESELGLIPKGWSVTKISDVCETKYGYTASAENIEIGPKFLRITDIVGSEINWDTVPNCKISEKDLPKYLLKEEDIVVARTGATVGYGKRLGKRIPQSIYASYLVRFRPTRRELKYLIGIQVESNTYKQFIKQNIQGSAQPQANAIILSSYNLIIPNDSLLQLFNNLVEPLLEKEEINNLQNEKLIELRDRLLPKLLNREFEGLMK